MAIHDMGAKRFHRTHVNAGIITSDECKICLTDPEPMGMRESLQLLIDDPNAGPVEFRQRLAAILREDTTE